MTVNFDRLKLKINYKKLEKMTGEHAISLFEVAARDLIELSVALAPKEKGDLRNTKAVYKLAGTEQHVETLVVAYGHVGGRSTYAIPQHLGAPDGNPLFWGHLFDLEYTTEGTDKEYLIRPFEDEIADQAMKLLESQLIAGFKG